ncbi:DUF6350 family protein [Kitasatospora paranensis]|uniref:DUF6350 family protein n=1 Tax=Kitasatospora paranensis TaxID=258053 RepID=A0ABW2FVL5_9ACTN
MTQLMGRPILGLPDDVGSRSVLTDVLGGVRTALLAFAVIAVPVLGLWVLTPYGDVTARGALRLACALWLLGHAAPLVRGEAGEPFTLTPLLLTAVTLVLLRRAGARAAGHGAPEAGCGAPSWRPLPGLCVGYLAVGAFAVAECAGPEAVLRARVLPDLIAVAAVAGLGIGWGHCSVRGMPRLPLPAALTDRFPGLGRPSARGDGAFALPGGGRWSGSAGVGRAVRAAVSAGLLGLVASGGLLLVAAIVVGDAGTSAAALADGAAGLLGLLLACTLLLPNAVLWAAGYALGPGFALGTDALASPLGGRLGLLPDFPLFALVPAVGPEAGGPSWRLGVGLLPLLAAAAQALLLGRAAARVRRGGAPVDRQDPAAADPWRAGTAMAAAVATAFLTGAAAAAAAWLAGGSLAAGRMAGLGPVPWQAGVAAAAWSAAVGLPGVLLVRWWLLRGAPAPTWKAAGRRRWYLPAPPHPERVHPEMAYPEVAHPGTATAAPAEPARPARQRRARTAAGLLCRSAARARRALHAVVGGLAAVLPVRPSAGRGQQA